MSLEVGAAELEIELPACLKQTQGGLTAYESS